MSIRSPHAVALIVAASFLAAPLLGEVTKTKKKASASPTKTSSSAATGEKPKEKKQTSSPSARKKSSPTPERRKSSPSPKPEPTPEDSGTPTQAGVTPLPTPAPPSTPAPVASPSPKPSRAPNASLTPEELVEYEAQPARVKALIADSLAMTTLNLKYSYGSADPANGGMDCSGTIYYILRRAGFKDVPRDSSSQYAWVRKSGGFRAVMSRTMNTFEFDELLPGDLLFWTGTYHVQRDIPVSHVMIYLGTERKTKRRVMFGASDGRTYASVQRWGVSVFDFQMPRIRPENAEGRGATFIGYGRIPGLRDPASEVAKTVTEAKDSVTEARGSVTGAKASLTEANGSDGEAKGSDTGSKGGVTEAKGGVAEAKSDSTQAKGGFIKRKPGNEKLAADATPAAKQQSTSRTKPKSTPKPRVKPKSS